MISQLLLYSLKAALTLTLLYVPYTLMLQKERFFRLNRFVLLGIIVLSMLLPLCNVSWMSLDNNPIMQATHQQMIGVGIPVRVVDDGITISYQLAEERASLSWFAILAIVFFVGMAISVVIRCLQLGILSYMMRHKLLWTKRQEDGIRICCRKGSFTPYSWLSTIFISEDDWNDSRREILLHETGHIRAHHSWDMLLMMLCQALQWYNPLVWMMAHSLAEVHEYEADDYVLRQGVEQQAYIMLLVKKVVEPQGYSFVNGLNKSSLRNRILMMKESVSANPWKRVKLLYLLPVCALVLSAFSTPNISSPVQKALTKLEDRGKEKADTLLATDKPVTQKGNFIQINEPSDDDPLIVIDGEIADNVILSDTISVETGIRIPDKLNPVDISDITVLKGAAATSLWGNRGKNGVIIINTKQAAKNVNDNENDNEDVNENNLRMEDVADRLPGVTRDSDGSFYLNGKKVNKLLVNGKNLLEEEATSEQAEE